MVSTWEDLGRLRLAGRKPTLPVIVTTNRYLPWNLMGVGAMTILHEAGKPFPVGLLDGLDVILMLDNCEQAGKVARVMRTKGFAWKSCESWCKCAKELVLYGGKCDEINGITLEAANASQ